MKKKKFSKKKSRQRVIKPVRYRKIAQVKQSPKDAGTFLRSHREGSCMSPKTLGLVTGISEYKINQIEANEAIPTDAEAARMALLLKFDLNDFLELL